MLDLRRDLYARLVISTQKDKSLNKSFRVIHSDSWDKYPVKKENDETFFERKLSDAPISNFIPNKIIKHVAVDKIDEKVEKIISDPKIAEIKMELEVAEKLLNKIKIIDAHNSKIPILEQTVLRMKLLLEQKSYI